MGAFVGKVVILTYWSRKQADQQLFSSLLLFCWQYEYSPSLFCYKCSKANFISSQMLVQTCRV